MRSPRTVLADQSARGLSLESKYFYAKKSNSPVTKYQAAGDRVESSPLA
ncbi:MAG: hypothetical protein HC886_10515 [Leptolyngbyaceae cyanobacterium SM1_1_3]|nr:hypothetical protein [Leptolyngbyaceae cyanobacterium SM1_1_3]NJN03576.1 hypothetical protein [Leptolyngbyaceae cyanobacterium RM1_1_2]NJO11375.1 hypothetical protein [Leptolyngbyaceae cyanobacterium SL_1_1]